MNSDIHTKKKILVVYYSQTGQCRLVIESVLHALEGTVEIEYAQIRPKTDFPFPWTSYKFFDAMPESVVGVPVALNPLPPSACDRSHDLIILGYQPWFLHPSIPVASFLQSPQAKQILEGKPVITVAGTRNMWLNAQEKIKQYLSDCKARHVGQIVLEDKHSNLISLLTVIRWAFKGKKQASGLLPEAGISLASMQEARVLGPCIGKHLASENYAKLQEELLTLGAVPLTSSLILLEKQGIKNFRFWGPFIRKKGGPGDPRRKRRLRTFQYLLLTGIFILSPLSALVARFKAMAQHKALADDRAYFSRCDFEPQRI